MEKTVTREVKVNLAMSLINAYKMLQIYPASNLIPQKAIEQAFIYLEEILKEEGSLYFRVSRQGIYEGNEKILDTQQNKRVAAFCAKVVSLAISSFHFSYGVSKTELTALLTLLLKEPQELEREGGPAGYLANKGIEHIKVNEIPRGVRFEETEQSIPIEKAAQTEEMNLLDILASLLLKNEFNEDELKLIGHLLTKPKDLRSVLYHVYTRGSPQGGNINLLEKVVLKLSELIEKKLEAKEVATESLIGAVATLPPKVSSELIKNLLFSAVRAVAAKEFLESFSPDELANLVIQAHKNEVARIERLSVVINNIDFRPDFKQALKDRIRQSLLEMGYSSEEATVISGGKQEEESAEIIEKGSNSSTRSIEFEETGIEAKELEDSPADLKLLNGLKFEAQKFKSDEHIFRSLLSMIVYIESEDFISELENHLRYLLPSLVSEEKFGLLSEAASFLKLLTQDKNLEDFKITFANRLNNELTKEKYVYICLSQIFEKMTFLDKDTPAFRQALDFLQKLPRETVISVLIKILSTEEMLSRRKLLIYLLTELSRNDPHLIGKRIDAEKSKWFLIRNLCTILGTIGTIECLPYLQEALKHNDLRVKKEALKAISQIPSKEAVEILLEEYSKADNELKKFILKNIGNTCRKEALQVLLPVAEAREFLLRDYEFKLSAIESLAKIPCTETLAALEKLSNLRSFFAASRARLIANAAKLALQALKTKTRSERP
jgi:hypothetical protein